MKRRAACLVAALLVAGWAADAAAASRYLPRLRFRVIVTPHFRVYYHQGGQAAARELAGIAEAVHRDLPARLRLRAPATTHVVLADQDDLANGGAIPLPYNTITINRSWPASQDLIGYTRDWLRLVFVHEYAHILQLDQSAGWAAGMRAVFGRSPLAFPNLALPSWEIEGFATFVESRETGEGRIHAGDARTLVAERVRQLGVEPLDPFNGGRVAWPGGEGPYLYGGLFHEYLANRFGEEKLGELSRRTAGRLHYLSAGAFRPVFGEDLHALWRGFQQDLRARTAETGVPGPLPRRITTSGFFVGLPRFAPDGASLFYSWQSPHGFPSIERLAAARGGRPERLTTRYAGEGLSLSSGYAFFDQVEVEENVALRSDLFAARLADGRTRRLTSGARLLDPAVSPDGRRLVAIHAEGGRRDLAWFEVAYGPGGDPSLSPARPPGGRARASGAVAPPGDRQTGPPDGDGAARYSAPRWSPDGRWVAAERRVPFGPSEIVKIDAGTGREVVLASTGTGRQMTPAWTPDGEAVLFALDRDGAFQVYGVPASGGGVVRLTSVEGGAQAPEVSPDGRRLVFVGYTAEGYDLFEVPFPEAARGQPVSPERLAPIPSPRAAVPEGAEAWSDRPYSPWGTLLPRWWAPAADTHDERVRAGATASGVDVLGRHAWSATVLWRTGDAPPPGGRSRALPDWFAGYTYDRWRTPFFASASDETSLVPRFAPDGRRLGDAEQRERHARAGLALPVVRARHRQFLEATLDYDRHVVTAAEGRAALSRHAFRSAWLFTSAKAYGYSIGPEEGGAVSVATEQVRRGLGADGNAQSWAVQGRWYLRAGGRHAVLALRAGAAGAWGDRLVRRTFSLGGSDPAPLLDYGSEAMAMLRGVDPLRYRGRRVAGATVEYRLPLVRVERGWRTFPLLLRTLHAAGFADAGHAWDATFAWRDLKASAGLELSADVVVGFGLPLTASAGVAWARDGASGWHSGATPYVRLGRSF